MVYFSTSTIPLEGQLALLMNNRIESVGRQLRNVFPDYNFNGLDTTKLTSEEKAPFVEKWTSEFIIPRVPTHFWKSKVIHSIPCQQTTRSKLFRKIFDIEHINICTNAEFHPIFDENLGQECRSINCNECLEHFHLDLECNPFKHVGIHVSK